MDGYQVLSSLAGLKLIPSLSNFINCRLGITINSQLYGKKLKECNCELERFSGLVVGWF